MDNNTNLLVKPANDRVSVKVKYLPIPLHCVPMAALNGMNIYAKRDCNYALIRSNVEPFDNEAHRKLLLLGIKVVYTQNRYSSNYYEAIEKNLRQVASHNQTDLTIRMQVVYNVTKHIMAEIYLGPIDQDKMDRINRFASLLVSAILSQKNALKCLLEAFDHDFDNATHGTNVCMIMIALAKRLRLDEDTTNQLAVGALLINIGNLFIDEQILNLIGTYTPEQYTQMKRHVQLGLDHLSENSNASEVVMAVVGEHHERFDGSGYPKGLAGDDISLYGRMAGVVDTLAALTSFRLYRHKVVSTNDACIIVESQCLNQFDKTIVDNLLSVLDGEMEDIVPLSFSNGFRKRAKRLRIRVRAEMFRIVKQNDTYKLGEKRNVTIMNLSRSGIALLSIKEVPLNTPLMVYLPLSAQKNESVVCTVRRCQTQLHGLQMIGAEFSKPLSENLLASVKKITRATDYD